MKTLLAVSLLLFTACAPLSRHDSVLGDVGEVAGRAILCPITICLSELHFYEEWEKEKRQEQQRQYNAWYESLSPERQADEDQRRHERQLGAMQALGMMNMGRGTGLTYTPSPIIRPPVSDPMPVYQPRQRLNCTR